MTDSRIFLFASTLACGLFLSQIVTADESEPAPNLSWSELAELPPPTEGASHPGLAGPFAGIHGNVLIIAGGANFPDEPLWESDKAWHADIHVLIIDDDDVLRWENGGKLPRPIAYGASASIPNGVLCLGGTDGKTVFSDVFSMAWDADSGTIVRTDFPPLPAPNAYGQATVVGTKVYLAGGQTDPSDLSSAGKFFCVLDLSEKGSPEFAWKVLTPWPGPERAFNITTSQHNGYTDCLYLYGGRRIDNQGETEFLRDLFEFNPTSGQWRKRADSPRPNSAGIAAPLGQSHIAILGGADGSLWGQADILKDDHPGFPKKAFFYHTITDTWAPAGTIPANHVTTVAIRSGADIIIPSGEIRPRVRSPKIWKVTALPSPSSFGLTNYIVLVAYLLGMVGIGLYFAKRNKSTDDFFRGGQKIAWWAAGCSIFATMLSSLTFTGVPSKAYAQDWVYIVGNFMIPVVAIVAVFVALPFYRRIDATSAYEYLEKRFSRSVRVIGSLFFTLFHIFRMAVVMSLTGLALAVATPLSPAECVLIMGVLSIIYCSMGGIEAVIWTDTIQTFVLLGGGILAMVLLINGAGDGSSAEGAFATAVNADKFKVANWNWDITSTQIALWVIIIGALGQNLSSYTADQAVVQRYLTTPDEKLAARSIWTNAVLSIVASLLFFGLGTALFAYYHAHPGKLDPTITTDQIFPLFISREMPVGLAGLIVAGIFAAAQSTVSTSMNSTATTVVTDFLRPLHFCKSERGYLTAARITTVAIGIVGTLIGLIFVNPDIKSLFDTFLVIIGLFMGVLGGLFVLGVMTRKAHAAGALVGVFSGAGTMFSLWKWTEVNGYLYTTTGIVTCFVIGYIASLVLPQKSPKAIEGLTIHSLKTNRGAS